MIKGYHTFYKFENALRLSYEEYHEIDVLAQLASILFWKKNYGSIQLYANQDHLDVISKYGIDKEYDGINTDLISIMPFKDKAPRYWSFSKIYIAKELAKLDEEFCIIDTDIWIKDKDLLKKENDLDLYHQEYYDPVSPYNPYHDPSNWMDSVDDFDWNCWPMNCAIMHFKKRSRELTEAWYDEVVKIIELDKNPEQRINKIHSAIFTEQRLLPVIAKKLNISYGAIKPNTFIAGSFREDNPWNEKWVPFLNSSEESIRIEKVITHLWGRRMLYKNPMVRIDTLIKTLNDLKQFTGIEVKYEKLFTQCYKIFEDSREEIIQDYQSKSE